MKRQTITTLLTVAAFIATPAFASDAGDDKVGEAVNCLVEEAGLTMGTVDQVHEREAHFTVIERESAIGIPVREVAFHPSVRAGNARGVDLEKVRMCMEGSRGPDWD